MINFFKPIYKLWTKLSVSLFCPKGMDKEEYAKHIDNKANYNYFVACTTVFTISLIIFLVSPKTYEPMSSSGPSFFFCWVTLIVITIIAVLVHLFFRKLNSISPCYFFNRLTTLSLAPCMGFSFLTLLIQIVASIHSFG